MPVAIATWIVGLGVVAIVLWAFALVDLLGRRSDLDRRHFSAWILVIVFLPIVGSIFYLTQRHR